MANVKVHMLWVSGSLTQLEIISARSFVSMGYDLSLWTYGTVGAVPDGVTLCDAREILPESNLFLNQQKSYAGFSDLFRYAVLRKYGGLYSDIDVLAMRPANELPAVPFFVTERIRNGVQINGNVIHSPSPFSGDVIDLAFSYASVFPKNLISGIEIGPALLTAIINIHPRHCFQIMPPDFANAINWWDSPYRLFSDEQPPECFFLHLYNDMWRRAGVDKNRPIAADTLLGRACVSCGAW